MMTPAAKPPTPIDWGNLIRAGEDLLNLRGERSQSPTDEHIRRAVSNAYYAMFHALAASNADVLVGTPQDAVSEEAWTRVYRGLDHGRARRELRQLQGGLSKAAQDFAGLFDSLQESRHRADYDPSAAFTAQQTALLLEIAKYACAGYLQADRRERAIIAALTTVEQRRARA